MYILICCISKTLFSKLKIVCLMDPEWKAKQAVEIMHILSKKSTVRTFSGNQTKSVNWYFSDKNH